ncbi:coiled-coil domain-containing protein 66 isoform X3 [Ochotona curzoniae]|uniref:coiled-coil domain-containing protein 66 isoform X3 n=1 Tax=Ochotona curzoniae TaxID=130825 RepID=UPI001B34AB36|nr:coiled-coil domain-containing protein 66 isoform X3 [Ochotona curzoniae]
MNLGDGLKLETELLDGKTKLILSPFERKSKISQKMGSKTKIVKCALRTKQSGHFIKSTQNSYIRSGKLAQNKTIDPETSQAKGEKHRLTFSPAKDLCKLYLDKDYLHIQDKISPATLNIQRTRNTANTSLVAKPQSCKKPMTAENMKGGLVCLTQDQLQQILMSVTQGNRPVSQPGDVREEETDQYSLNISNIPNEAKDENTVGLLQKVEGVSAILHGNGNQEACKQSEQKLDVENEWKPAGIFSTLGERERDRSLLEAKKAQWRKELDEQVALKKKEKEASEKWNNQWKKSDSNEALWEKCQDFDKSREAALPKHPFCAMQQQQKKWLEELNKQIEGDQQRKIEEKMISSKGEEHDRWAMHFDSLKSYPGSQSRLSSRSTHRPPEYLSVSPGTPELADVNSVCTPVTGSQADPSKEAHVEKPHRDVAMRNTQKTNFLRSMTALLDPAEIEERDRRRQKQLEHQKAITAQVEERRRKKQLEEEQRKKEELLEELRLAREREEMQKQYEEDVLRQKQKEEIMTLKTNALFQTMQRAQELAQRLKQEQKIRELAQKGHDTSRLTKNLGVDTKQLECNTATSSISNLRHNLDGVGATANTGVSPATSPKKDTAVQTEDLTTRIFTKAESYCESVTEREVSICLSPEISTGFNGQLKKNKQELSQHKGPNLEKENSWHKDECNQLTRTEKLKYTNKCAKRPEWNINKPLRRYIPASEKYPKQLQKQREEKKVRRQMELLHLVERNNPGHLSQSQGGSPAHELHRERQPRSRRHLGRKEAEPLNMDAFIKERSVPSPVPAVRDGSQHTQTGTLHLASSSSYERENVISGSQTGASSRVSEPSHFIPYVRTNEVYYLDPDAPLSRPSTQDLQYESAKSSDQDQQQLFDCDVRDPLLNPNLVKHRDRQQAILKGLSELRQGLLQKQKELESNLLPSASNPEEF